MRVDVRTESRSTGPRSEVAAYVSDRQRNGVVGSVAQALGRRPAG